jgi:hypothetical protein
LLLVTVAAVLAALLDGCNMVVSRTPWFTETDAEPAVRLKPGVWAEYSNCAPDGRLVCDVPVIEVTRTELRLPAPRNLRPEEAQQVAAVKTIHGSYLIVRGNPVIIQVQVWEAGESRAELIAYLGFVPTQRDDDGQVVAGDVWKLACGPQPGPGDDNYGLQDEQGSVTNHPLPGLTMDDGLNCVAADRATLMRVARDGRSMNGALRSIHWRSPPAPPDQN